MTIILFITDHGDESVGIFGAEFKIQTPFHFRESDKEALESFKKDMISLYGNFCHNCTAQYDWERQEEINRIERERIKNTSLTPYQEKVLELVNKYGQNHGVVPSYIASQIHGHGDSRDQFGSTSSVYKALRKLTVLGKIRAVYNSHLDIVYAAI